MINNEQVEGEVSSLINNSIVDNCFDLIWMIVCLGLKLNNEQGEGKIASSIKSLTNAGCDLNNRWPGYLW